MTLLVILLATESIYKLSVLDLQLPPTDSRVSEWVWTEVLGTAQQDVPAAGPAGDLALLTPQIGDGSAHFFAQISVGTREEASSTQDLVSTIEHNPSFT